jgi:hypothetical protein
LCSWCQSAAVREAPKSLPREWRIDCRSNCREIDRKIIELVREDLKTGMRPDAASMMTRPGGVGFWSLGPIGAVGSTMMASKWFWPIMVSTNRSAATLLYL